MTVLYILIALWVIWAISAFYTFSRPMREDLEKNDDVNVIINLSESERETPPSPDPYSGSEWNSSDRYPKETE